MSRVVSPYQSKKSINSNNFNEVLFGHMLEGFSFHIFPKNKKGSITEGTCEYWKIQLWLNCVSLHTPNDQAIQ